MLFLCTIDQDIAGGSVRNTTKSGATGRKCDARLFSVENDARWEDQLCAECGGAQVCPSFGSLPTGACE
jgi:hypothetical protein